LKGDHRIEVAKDLIDGKKYGRKYANRRRTEETKRLMHFDN